MASFRGSTRRILRHGALGGIVAATLLVTACTAEAEVTEPTPRPTATVEPSPSPTPTLEPTVEPVDDTAGLSDLVLTPDGLNGLAIGQPIPEAMAVWTPGACRIGRTGDSLNVLPESDPAWDAFLPTYPSTTRVKDGHEYIVYPYDVHHDDAGDLAWLRVNSPEIRTDRGIHVGSSEADVIAAYPDAVREDDGSAGWYQTYNIESGASRLVIEVTFRDFDSTGPREVWMMRLDPTEWPRSSLGGGDAGGFCALEV